MRLFPSLLLALGLVGVAPHPARAAAYCGHASYYGTPSDGYGYRVGQMTTASGERFYPNDYTVAHRSLPFGTKLKVTNQSNGKSIVVRVNDRGPFVGGRILDLSYGAFTAISSPSTGVANVCYSKI